MTAYYSDTVAPGETLTGGSGGGGDAEDVFLFPLSFAQQRLWFLDQLEPGNPFYNISTAVRLKGSLDALALAGTLCEVIRRHESLRTTFSVVDGEPMQVISPVQIPSLTVDDLSHLDEDTREAEVRRLAREEAQIPFDLGTGPLLRARLLRLGAEEHAAFFTMHHIVSDAWSFGVLIREVTTLYAAYAQGQPSPLAELPLQYADFADWQRGWMSGDVLERELHYWKTRLAGAPPVLALPLDRPRPAVKSFRGATCSFLLPAELTERLRKLCQDEGVTPFMLLLAAWQALLARYSGQEDIVVGTPIAGRNRSETEPLIGFFVNTLVLRTDLSGQPTFGEILKRVREVSLGAYAHQDVPFEKLVEELEPERSLSHTPLFQIAFALQNAPASALELPGLELSLFDVGAEVEKFDLTLSMTEGADNIGGTLGYDTELFDAATVERMTAHFRRLLEEVAADSRRRPAMLPLLTPAEQLQLTTGWNDTRRDYATGECVHELVAAQAARRPASQAFNCGDARLTYGELNERANRLARYLRAAGVNAEDLVCLLLERSAELAVAALGVLKAGAAYVPLDPSYPQERLSFMLADTGAKVLLTREKLAELLSGDEPNCRAICLDREADEIAREAGDNLPGQATPGNLAYVIYTSGSTGRPKGVQVSHGALLNLVRWHRDVYDVAPEDRATLLASVGFDASVWELWPYLTAGASLHVPDDETRTSPESLRDWLVAARIDICFLPTPLAESVLSLAWPRESALRYMLTGGDGLHNYPQPTLPFKLVNHYGPTESTVVATSVVLAAVEDALAPPPIGRPIANTQVYLLDRLGQLVLPGVAGELYIGGAGVARGYLNRPALTAERFVPDSFGTEPGARLYRTGDVARWLPGGELEFLGRADQQVKLRGYRIELGEIEVALSEHPSIGECACMVRDDGAGRRQLVAYVVARDGATATRVDLVEDLRLRLPEYMIPTAFVMLAELPLTPNGKLDRRALPEPDQTQMGTRREFVAPRTPVEALLAQVWSQVLGLERVGVHDNFFALGGHSLLATQLVSRVRAAFKTEVPLRALFSHPTVAELGREIEAGLKAGAGLDAPPIVAVPRDETTTLPLSFAQQRLWFLDQLQPGSHLYNVPVALRLSGSLDPVVLARAFSEVVSRHESLRTSFAEADGQPVQIIHTHAPLALHVEDLGGLDEATREAEARRLSADEARRPFDLNAGAPLRIRLLRLAEQEHVLLFTLHHIITDGWSMNVLVREVTGLYEAFLKGEESPLVELPIQYADFAVWQRTWMSGEVLERELDYWRRQLAGAPPVLELPLDKPRPAIRSARGATHYFTLEAKVADELRRLSAAEGATLFMTLLAGFQSLLSRYAGQSDIVVGSPIAGRNRAETEPLIGFFVNTLALRTDLSGDPSFRETVGRVREVCLGAYAHQDVPFEKLVEELEPERSLSHTPLFQVMFAMQQAAEAETAPGMGSLRLSAAGREAEATATAVKFDLTLSAQETESGAVECGWGYNTDLFEAETVERLTSHLLSLLSSAAADSQQPLSSLNMLSEAEQGLLIEWNQTERAYPQGDSIHGLFAAQAARTPDSIALVGGNKRLTYRELNARAELLAHYLRARGVRPETLVGVYMYRSVEMVVALLGVLKAGGAYVPLDPAYPATRLEFILRDAQAALVLTQGSLVDTLPDGGATVRALCLDTQWTEIAAEHPDAPTANGDASAAQVMPDNLAYLIYTSGSTGRPKGVAITHGNAVTLLHWARETFAAADLRGVLAATSICFDLSVFELFVPLSWGGSVILAENALQLPMLAAKDEVTLVNTVPSVMTELLRAGGVPDGVRIVNLAGEALPARLVREIYRQLEGAEVVNLYGPSEDTTYSTMARLSREDAGRTPPIGRPIANTQAYVLGATLQPAPVGVVGEVYLSGDGLARGYLNRPELTAERFIPHPHATTPGARLYQTGDLARYLPDGQLDYLGRADHQVKVRGFRIELGEVETALCAHASVAESVCVVWEETPGVKHLVAYVVGAGAIGAGALIEHLRARLPEYMVPSAFVMLDALPLTPNGKLDRCALPEPVSAGRGSSAAYLAPRDAVELRLGKIWEDVLGVESVGVRDRFFDLGGHSLVATRLMHRIEREFARRLPLAALFESPTVEHLAVLLRRRQAEASASFSPLVEIQPKGARTPFFCVHPSGGNVLCYAELSRHLGGEQPFYGLQARGLDDAFAPHASIEEMARDYVAHLRAAQPEGPYLLGGWSMGGVVAYEMARQLEATGAEVALLALLDSALPRPQGARPPGADELSLLRVFALDMGLAADEVQVAPEELANLGLAERLEFLLGRAVAAGVLPPDVAFVEMLRLFEVFKANVNAMSNYVPRPVRVPVTLFRATERSGGGGDSSSSTAQQHDAPRDEPGDADAERDESSDADAEVRRVPGSHFTLIREPHVRVLAEELGAAIARALVSPTS